MDLRRSLIFVLAVVLLGASAASAATDPRSAVMTTVQHFVHDFNVGTLQSVEADCEPSTIIIDNFAPHVWSGPNACGQWYNAYNVMAQKNGITDEFVTLHAPWHVDVDGDTAYVVNPAKDTYLQHGKRVTFEASIFTVVLKREAGGWSISGWAWSDH